MRYAVRLESSAENQLKALPADALRRMDVKLRSLANDPRPKGAKKLQGKSLGWRVRVGTYRILYTIDDTKQIVTVYRIAQRAVVYRKRRRRR